MTETDGASEILKSDKLGRVQVPQERREAILDEFERSGNRVRERKRIFHGHLPPRSPRLAAKRFTNNWNSVADPNVPRRPRAFGGKGAKGMKKEIPAV